MREKRKISSLDVISSSVCNMRCSFCYLHKNEAYVKFDKEVQEAWKNGSYVDNIKKVIERLNGDCNEIIHFDLWGGETTSSLDNITDNIPTLFSYFPNLCNFGISTNFSLPVGALINFIKKIDLFAVKEVTVRIQLSIDGPDGEFTKQGHPGTWETYRKNFDEFFTEIEKLTLLHVTRIRMPFNSTINKDLYLNTFTTVDGMKDYMSSMYTEFQAIKERAKHIKSTRVVVVMGYPGVALPFNSTVEEGMQFANSIRLWEYVKTNFFEEETNKLQNDYFLRASSAYLRGDTLTSSNRQCSQFDTTLTILPDGTIVECNGSYINNYKPYQEELKENNETHLYNIAKLMAGNVYNPLTMTDEEIERMNWILLKGYRNTFTTYNVLKLGMCEELAKSGQIPKIYATNKEMALRYITMMAKYCTCSRENMNDTHIPYLPSAAQFRRYMNGALQYIYENYTETNRSLT